MFVPRSTYREVTWIPLPSSQSRDSNAAQRQLVAIFSRELQAPALNFSNSTKPYTTRPPLSINPLPVIPVCSRTVQPLVTGLCFDAPLVYDTATSVSHVYCNRCVACVELASHTPRYNRIDLFAPAGVTYANGSSLQVPFFSLAPVSFKSPEAFVPKDAAKLNFRNVQALVEAVNSGVTPMRKSSAFVGDGLTAVAEAELKALSLLANRWPTRNLTRAAALVKGSPVALKLLSSATVFAVAVDSAVAFEFPGQKSDGMEQSSSQATQFSPAFASSLSNLNSLSLTWSSTSSAVVASVPIPFPAREANNLIPRRFAASASFMCTFWFVRVFVFVNLT